jgi:hypothetical protein
VRPAGPNTAQDSAVRKRKTRRSGSEKPLHDLPCHIRKEIHISCDVAPLDMNLAIHYLNKYGISPKLDDDDLLDPDQGDGFHWPKSNQ